MRQLRPAHGFLVRLALGLSLLAMTAARSSLADPAAEAAKAQKRECAEAYEKGQELRAAEQLLEAQRAFLVCSKAQCPEVLNHDCLRWLDDLESRTPSFAIAIQHDGQPVTPDRVLLDNELVAPEMLGKTQTVNPGLHEVRAELKGFEPITKKIRLLPGQRLLDVTINFESPKIAPLPTPAPASSETLRLPGREEPASTAPPTLTYVLLGVAAAGGAGFATFGLIGKDKESSLDHCKPDCRKVDVDERDRDYLIGDISLAVGVGALIGAGVSYWLRPAPHAATASVTPQLTIAASASSCSLTLRSAF